MAPASALGWTGRGSRGGIGSPRRQATRDRLSVGVLQRRRPDLLSRRLPGIPDRSAPPPVQRVHRADTSSHCGRRPRISSVLGPAGRKRAGARSGGRDRGIHRERTYVRVDSGRSVEACIRLFPALAAGRRRSPRVDDLCAVVSRRIPLAWCVHDLGSNAPSIHPRRGCDWSSSS